MAKTQVRGLDQLIEQLRALPENIEKQVLSHALREGAKVYVAAMKRQVDGLPISASGKRKLKRALLVRPIRMRRMAQGSVAFGVKLKRGRTGTKGQKRTKEVKAGELPFWWYFLEHGTAQRFRGFGDRYLDSRTFEVARAATWDPRGQKFRRATTERKTLIVVRRKGRAATGRITATPFIRTAIDGAHASARAAIEAAAKKRFAQGVIQRASRRAP